MSQTSYNSNIPAALPGLIADGPGAPRKIQTYNNPVLSIPFGLGVAKISADEDGIKLPDGSGVQIEGVAVRDVSRETDGYYAAKSAVAIMKRGRIWVVCEVDVTPDDPVYIRYATGGGGSQKGIFRNSADTATALQLVQARFLTGVSTVGGVKLAILDINIP